MFAMIFDWIIKLENLTSASNKVNKKMAVVPPPRLSYNSAGNGISVKDGAY